jgi:hypothetical protein
MRRGFSFCLLLAVIGCGGQPPRTEATSKPIVLDAAATPTQARTTGERTLGGAHFDAMWDEATAAEDDARRVLERAEGARARFVDLLGKERVGERRIRIRLAGDGDPRRIPTVDPQTGDILLYRFPGPGGAYDAPVAHELVHAIRWPIWTRAERQTDPALFWEEGFAELLAREAGFPSAGFPLYGVDPAVGAASFVTRGEALPIPKLIAEHRALNFRCMSQAYVERISFMSYVRSRIGIAPMIAVAYVDAPLDVPTMDKVLGVKIDALAAEHDKMLTSTEARAEAREAGTRFRETTPVRYLPTCPR